MQVDMHFYGVYCLARAAGIPSDDAYTIAYASQYTDDATEKNSDPGQDGALMFAIATAHRPLQSVANSTNRQLYESTDDYRNLALQRQIWVPFHFLPGGRGDTLEHKMICVQNSGIVNAVVDYQVQYAQDKKGFGLHGLGIALHGYMDSFSHDGFIGESSELNSIKFGSLKINNASEQEAQKDTDPNTNDQAFSIFKGHIAAAFSGSLGHGSVLSYPDIPYLNWQFEFEKPRSGWPQLCQRDNPAIYLQACEALYNRFIQFRKHYYDRADNSIAFDQISSTISTILAYHGDKQARSQQWLNALNAGHFGVPARRDATLAYNEKEWEDQKQALRNKRSPQVIASDIYKFHQAAALQRWYVLKDLLPQHEMAVL